MRVKPVSVLAFLFTVVATLFVVLAFCLPRWFVLLRLGGDNQLWHGLWQQQACSPRGCGDKSPYTRIEGGKEFFFIIKVFQAMALLLVVIGFLTHLVYICQRKPVVRQAAIYALCGAGLFSLMSSLMFVAMYQEMAEYRGQAVELGECFPLALVGAIMCLVATAFTAWATYNKANFDDDDEDDHKEITHEMKPGDMDKI